MNVTWERSFEFSHPVERVWDGYFEHQGGSMPEEGARFTLTDAAASEIEITKVVRHERFEYSQTQKGDRSEMAMSFESTETGTRITVTRYGFGEGNEFEVFRQSNPLGWTELMQDLAIYLATGVSARRHLKEQSATGVVLKETMNGLEVISVREGSLGAAVGLQPRDIVMYVNGAAIYERSDMWLVTRLFAPGTEVEVGYVRGGEARRARGEMSPVAMAVTGELGLGPRID